MLADLSKTHKNIERSNSVRRGFEMYSTTWLSPPMTQAVDGPTILIVLKGATAGEFLERTLGMSMSVSIM